MRIEDKVAIVTGAAVGSGQAIAERLADEGAAVALVDIAAREGEETLRRIRDRGGKGVFRQADLTDAAEVGAAVDFAVETFGGVDILVNNAGGGGHIPPHFPDATPAQWGALLDLNLRMPLLATQLVLGTMSRRGSGAVVNIGSTAGLGTGYHQSVEYAAAKAGLIRASTSLVHLRRTHSVRVNCVVPDWIETDRARRELAAMSEQERAAQPPLVPLRELCDHVVALITDDAAVGRAIVLDRGHPPRVLNDDPDQGRGEG
ncbi:SDR family NAD(P)-dependent oxidoreductase [Streptomyces bathyalis]|uniref:SDR family NAD(P)-dependent oxidoreductase n=1 Tax=Streptomyces bathyalis TaxID=2710756 RepID=A0A7T1T4V1_9ACTN|nr:SDR family NAD(P)-dependent oxidoreductase [Streptomyces bathyalis]QPP06435.1 SDR family NAD(P)-dependent oxidoreductase [Streptomyces bathyalis]